MSGFEGTGLLVMSSRTRCWLGTVSECLDAVENAVQSKKERLVFLAARGRECQVFGPCHPEEVWITVCVDEFSEQALKSPWCGRAIADI